MLLANGCSFVWGDELEGYKNSPPTHWDKTFTHLVADNLDMDYINLAECGNGNRKIFRDTMRYLRTGKDKDKITHAIVLWSAFERNEIAESMGPGLENLMKIKRHQCMTQYSPARINTIYNKDLAQALDYLYDHYDDIRTSIMETMTYMTATQMIMEQMGIKYVSGMFHYRCWEELVDVMKPHWQNGNNPNRHWGEWMIWIQDELNSLKDTSRLGLNRYTDLATISETMDDVMPALHAGEKSQKVFAEVITDIFESELL